MWRHRWPALAVAWFIGIVGIVVVLAVPDKYEASARIFVDTQSILKPLMSGLAVQPNVEQQVVMLSRTLISRPNVEKLIRMADLDLASNSKSAQEALVEKLTKGLQIRNTGRDNLYTLAYQDENPERAKRVVQSLVSIFVESSLGATRKDSDSAKKFIDEQIKTYVVKLEEAEARLKEFRLRNMELQGADGQDMAGKSAGIAAQLNQAKLELREAEKSRDSAKRQIEGPSWERKDWPQQPLDERVAALDGNWTAIEKALADGKVSPDLRGQVRAMMIAEGAKRASRGERFKVPVYDARAPRIHEKTLQVGPQRLSDRERSR